MGKRNEIKNLTVQYYLCVTKNGSIHQQLALISQNFMQLLDSL